MPQGGVAPTLRHKVLCYKVMCHSLQAWNDVRTNPEPTLYLFRAEPILNQLWTNLMAWSIRPPLAMVHMPAGIPMICHPHGFVYSCPIHRFVVTHWFMDTLTMLKCVCQFVLSIKPVSSEFEKTATRSPLHLHVYGKWAGKQTQPEHLWQYTSYMWSLKPSNQFNLVQGLTINSKTCGYVNVARVSLLT